LRRRSTELERFFSKKWAAPLSFLCLSIVILLAYSNTINGAFQLDDKIWITDNPLIRDLSNLPAMLRSQRGLTMASFALNYAMGGLDPRGYHLVNITIHILNAILVYILLTHTFILAGFTRPRAKFLSLLCSAIFSLHPVQTEAVTYIVQRMESMSATFCLLSLIAFIHAVRAKGTIKKYTTIAPLGGFNDISRETSRATAPATLRHESRYADIPALKSLPTAGFGVVTTTPTEYFMTESNVLLYYYSLLILPINQNIDYDFPLSRGLFTWPKADKNTSLTIPLPPPIVSILIHIALIALAVFLFARSLGGKKSPTGQCISFFIIWFFVVLSPTSSFIPIVDVIFEHRLYLASLGYAVILTLIIEKIIMARQDRASAV